MKLKINIFKTQITCKLIVFIVIEICPVEEKERKQKTLSICGHTEYSRCKGISFSRVDYSVQFSAVQRNQ